MKGWKSVKLRDVITKIQYGYTESASSKEIGPKFLRITDIAKPVLDWESVPYCKTSSVDHKKYKLFVGDIVVARTGNTTGAAKLIRKVEDAVFASYLVRFKVNQEIADHFFIGQLIESKFFYDYIWSIIGGAAQPGANAQLMADFQFKLPPLPTQKKIAGILSAYDDAIENNLRALKLLEEMAQITYEEWFVRLRFPGYATTPINPATGLPEGWENEKVGNVLSKIKTTKKIQNSEFLPKGLIPIVDQSRDFIAGYTDEPEALLNMDQPLIIFGDHTRILKFINFPFARGADGTQVLLSKEPRMPQHLFYLSLIAVDLSNYHYARHFKFLKDSEIILPSKEVADEFEKYSNDKFILIRELRNQNQHLREARDILLPRLMTGVIDAEKYQPENFLKKN